MSVLDHCKSSNRFQPFWTEKEFCLAQERTTEPLLRDQFLISEGGALVEHEIYLTPTSVYYRISENRMRSVKIKWAVIESFYEEVSETCLYGFRVIRGEGKEDFFTTSETVLEQWLEKLSGLSMLTGFEQDFMIVKRIDSGKFGEVYLCQDIGGTTDFAVKCIQKQFLNTPEQIKHVRGEIKALRSTNHPLCIKLYRVYEELNSIILVLEYIPYGTLLNRLQKSKKLPEYEVAHIAHQLITALMHLNSLSIIHRDLKLDNILMASLNSDIKIIDFGLAVCSSKPQTNKCGSPGFMAPEMLNDQEYDKKVDIFSVGAICYTLLTGKLLFSGKTTKELLDKNEKCEIKFDKKDWKDCSALGLNFIQGLLNKDKTKRPTAELALAHPWLNRFIQKFDSEVPTQTASLVYIELN